MGYAVASLYFINVYLKVFGVILCLNLYLHDL